MGEQNNKMSNEMQELLNALHEGVQKGGQTLKEIDGQLERIEKLVSAVREISGKTDLLALNASIEAARAGQSGKGFSVVADEVARLSENAQDSIGEMESLFGGLRERMRQMLSQMEDCAGKSNRLQQTCTSAAVATEESDDQAA